MNRDLPVDSPLRDIPEDAQLVWHDSFRQILVSRQDRAVHIVVTDYHTGPLRLSKQELDELGRMVSAEEAPVEPAAPAGPPITAAPVTPGRRILFQRQPGKLSPAPDPDLLKNLYAPRVLEALQAASAQLLAAGIKYTLVGSLALAAYGLERVSATVELLVQKNTLLQEKDGVVTLVPGIPVQAGGCEIGLTQILAGEEFLERDLANSIQVGPLRLPPIETLVYLMLRSGQPRDLAEVQELIRMGLDRERIAAYLSINAPDLVPVFDALVNSSN